MARAKNTRVIKGFVRHVFCWCKTCVSDLRCYSQPQLVDVKAELRDIEDIAETKIFMEQTGYKGTSFLDHPVL
jgi:hypothetical protein